AEFIVVEQSRHRAFRAKQGADRLWVGRGRRGTRRSDRDRGRRQEALDATGAGTARTLQEMIDRVWPVAGRLQHPVQQVTGEAAGKLPEITKQLSSGVRIRQRPMRMRMAQ